jgi:homeobox protein aristaless-related
MGAFYSPTASFQTLLANISAAQRSSETSKPSPEEYPTSSSSATTSPALTSTVPIQTASPQPAKEDLKTSSIAALRLKAREHELKLEMLRQKGHNVSDIIS